MKTLNEAHSYLAQIKVVGIGGAGGNAVNRMRSVGLAGVEFISINTDAQVLMSSEADIKIAIGTDLTKGLGAGGNPEVGKQAAESDLEAIKNSIAGADMVFLAVGEGGGTGTGAAPVIAEAAREQGSLTIAVATRPFSFEGQQRKEIAHQGLEELKDRVDARIVIPNDRLVSQVDPSISLDDAFGMVDEVLMQAVRGVTDLITRPGLINIDFADIKSILGNAGSTLIGVGEASGEERGTSAARKAISNPLLEDSIQSARGVILNITGGDNPPLTMNEASEAATIVEGMTHENCNFMFGTVADGGLSEKLRVTVIAAGFASPGQTGEAHLRSGNLRGRNPALDDILGLDDSGISGSDALLDDDGEEIDLPDFLK